MNCCRVEFSLHRLVSVSISHWTAAQCLGRRMVPLPSGLPLILWLIHLLPDRRILPRTTVGPDLVKRVTLMRLTRSLRKRSGATQHPRREEHAAPPEDKPCRHHFRGETYPAGPLLTLKKSEA